MATGPSSRFGQFQEAQPDLQCSYAGVAGPETQQRLGIKIKVDQLVAKFPLLHNATNSWAKDFRVERIMYSHYGYKDAGGVTGREIMRYIGLGFVLSGYDHLIGGRITYSKGQYTFHGPKDPDLVEVKKSECAALVQAFGLPHTSKWRRGPRVKDLPQIKRGTVVATLRDDQYYQETGPAQGRTHVGIFLSQDNGGISILDQSNTHSITKNRIKFEPDDMGEERKQDKRPWRWTADGDEYFVLYSTEKCGKRDYDA